MSGKVDLDFFLYQLLAFKYNLSIDAMLIYLLGVGRGVQNLWNKLI